MDASLCEVEALGMAHQIGMGPMIGIFWFLEDRLLTKGVPLGEAEPYDKCLTFPCSHIDYWETLRVSGKVPEWMEYEEVPRGRVVYDTRLGRFTIFADACILVRPDVLEQIMTEMDLPIDATDAAPDAHYRCYRCLGWKKA